MGQLIRAKQADPNAGGASAATVLRETGTPPAERTFGIAVRLPANSGQALIALAVLVGFAMLCWAILAAGNDQQALIDAKDETIAALEMANRQLVDSNDKLAAANDNLTHVASKTVTGLSTVDFVAFGSICMMALGLTLLCVPCLAPGGAAFGIVGAILLIGTW